MRNRITTFVAVVLLVSCTKTATGQHPTPADISNALPTITEMPGKWNETQRQVFQKRANENPSLDPSVWCTEASQVTAELPSLAGGSGADVEMQSDDSNDGARMMRLQAWSNDDVAAYFTNAAEAARICDGKSGVDADGVGRSWSLVENRDIGDESVSWVDRTVPPAATQGDKFESIGRTTIARFGGILMVMQIGDANWTGTTNQLAEDDWWAVVELAGRKLAILDAQVHD
ncbi:MAG: hypothetical protein RLZZ305_1602 [Actinomycetota bacterium]|jgi:hypothetical protein